MFTRAAALSLLALATTQVAAKPLEPRQLSFDDVIVMSRDGSSTVMKDFEYEGLKNRAVEAAKRAPAAAPSQADMSKLATRGCEESSEVQVLTDTNFLNWDTPLSSVISAQGGDSTVSITDGYSISNSLTIGASATAGFLEGVLSISYSINYQESWTSSSSLAYSFTVPSGQFGLIVSEPMVHRITGNYLSGCTDSPTVEAFTSDSYSSQSYGNLNWVTGVIRLCNSTQYPIPYCIGDGTHS